jgi:hypothetical protein
MMKFKHCNINGIKFLLFDLHRTVHPFGFCMLGTEISIKNISLFLPQAEKY